MTKEEKNLVEYIVVYDVEHKAAGACPCYNVGDEFIFYRDENNDHFWHGGLNTLVKTDSNPDTVVGGPKMPHCSEA